MRRQVMMVLASAALVGSLLATDAQARGGGGHGGGGGGVRVAGFGGARVGGMGGRYTAGIPRATVGYARGTAYGTGIGNRMGILRGTGLGYGPGILRGRLSVLSAAAFAQTATPYASAGAYVPAPANDAVQNPPVGGPSPQTGSGPRDGVSTTTVEGAGSSASAWSTTQSRAAPAFRSGNLVRLRSEDH